MTTQIALMRGINLGPHKRIGMPELKRLFAEAGADDVRHYLQSGNIVFAAPGRQTTAISDAVTAAIVDRFGVTVPILTVTADDLRAIAEANPYRAAGVPDNELHLMLLSARPDAERVAALDPDRSPGDAFTVEGRAIYLHLPNGAARSKLTNDWFDRALKVTSTSRNWRTVTALLDLSVVTP